MPEFSTHYTPPIGPQGVAARAPIVTPLEEMRINKYRNAMADLAERGWSPASVINLHPWKLYASGVLLRELKIPGVPLDGELWKTAIRVKLASGVEIPYVKHTFMTPDVTILEQVMGFEGSFTGNTDTQTTLPIKFAQDVVWQNNTPEPRGGVFCYVGAHDPLAHANSKDEHKAEQAAKEQSLLESAHASAIMHYNSLLAKANEAYAENNAHKIREVQQYPRWAARYLRNLGLLASDPTWLTASVKVGPAVTKHCVCGAEVKSQSLVCKDCNHILEPFEAYKQGVFDEETPGGLLALRRLDKKQLVELGLYPRVLPKEEHLKQKAKEQKQ